jgi:poly(hydroxyalkanoate) depolymerase family esterase
MRAAMRLLRPSALDFNKTLQRILAATANEAAAPRLRRRPTEAGERSDAVSHFRFFDAAVKGSAFIDGGLVNEEAAKRFQAFRYRNSAGQRDYKVYVPASIDRGTSDRPPRPVPLIVMLHGCRQDADDFAIGTRMNAFAEQFKMIIAYPAQSRVSNPAKCWNWFRPGEQQRDKGEPSIIAGITRDILDEYPVDPARVYIAGLSAGGAMAMIMIRTYPDLYAAAAVHSGLPFGAARDLPSALAAMRAGVTRPSGPNTAAGQALSNMAMENGKRSLIVFHGDADATVHVHNAKRILSGFETKHVRRTHSNDRQRAFRVIRSRSAQGADAELWLVQSGPHAWFGGDSDGSYTDPKGPDATAEIVRFFLAHPLRDRAP